MEFKNGFDQGAQYTICEVIPQGEGYVVTTRRKSIHSDMWSRRFFSGDWSQWQYVCDGVDDPADLEKQVLVSAPFQDTGRMTIAADAAQAARSFLLHSEDGEKAKDNPD